MGYIDDNFEYSTESNNRAKKYKFIVIGYDLEIIKIEEISSMHQLDSMLFGKATPCIGKPTYMHSKRAETFRAVFLDADDIEKVVEKLKEFGKSILEELSKEGKERELGYN